jgi:ubiquinone/menaquinone biosynthesis C-methylase UbiE
MEINEYQRMFLVEDYHWWYRGLRRLVADNVSRLISETSDASILDAGCGTGGTMQVLSALVEKKNLIGIDINHYALCLTEFRNVGAVTQASIEMLPFNSGSFDIAISLDVLCLDRVDEKKAIIELSRVLKPQGHLIINLPAFNSLRGEHDKAVSIRYRYKIKEVKQLLVDLGFQPKVLRYWNSWLFPITALYRIKSRLGHTGQPKSDHYQHM